MSATPPPTHQRPQRSAAQTLDRLLHPREQHAIVEAIRAMETSTTGEIKVHVEARCLATDPYTRAVELFDKLGLHRTDARNGVLIYAAVHDRRYAVIGDIGIDERPDSEFWAEAQRALSVTFRRGAFGEGLIGAVHAVGERLQRRFPWRPEIAAATGVMNKDEIENAISTEDTWVSA
jgi:uncharacterized membrane protein